MNDLDRMQGFEIEADESVMLVVRRHWALLALRLTPALLLALAPYILLVSFTGTQPTALARFLLGVWWLILWFGAFSRLTRYYLNAWIITTSRIIDIRQPAFFKRDISSFLLDRVQDVSTAVIGMFATMIGFGTLSVETAGRDEHFVMDGVPDPEGVRDLIMREVAALHSSAGATHTDGL